MIARTRPLRPRHREPAKASPAAASPTGRAVVRAGRISCCSPAASRWALGDTIRGSSRSWRLREQEADFVPSLRVATVEAESRHHVGHPAGHDGRIRRGEHLCPRDRLYRQAQCRHRRSRQGRAICWRSSPCPSSMIRFRRTRRRSISSSRRWSRRRPTESSRR